jgi:hypothetical protein
VIAPTASLACTFRQAALILRIDRGATLHQLIRQGDLTPVPWGKRKRIPLEQIQALARRGFTISRKPSRAVSRARRSSGAGAVLRIRDLEIDP